MAAAAMTGIWDHVTDSLSIIGALWQASGQIFSADEKTARSLRAHLNLFHSFKERRSSRRQEAHFPCGRSDGRNR